jgi:hypothetical protein
MIPDLDIIFGVWGSFFTYPLFMATLSAVFIFEFFYTLFDFFI